MQEDFLDFFDSTKSRVPNVIEDGSAKKYAKEICIFHLYHFVSSLLVVHRNK